MAKKNIGNILLYAGIFTFLAIMISAEQGNGVENGFTAEKMNILLADEDKSELSEAICSDLKKHHHVTMGEYDKKKLYEELYYQKIVLVIHIPKGMQENVEKGRNTIELSQSPGSYSSIYAEQQINRLVAGILSYRHMGYSIKDAYQKMADAPVAEVSMLNKKGENTKYSGFFRCVPYMFTAGLGTGIAVVIFSFRKKQIKNRMMSSSVSLARQNFEAVLAVLLIGIFLYLLTLAIAFIFYGAEIFQSETALYYLLNLFLSMLFALSMAFLVGMTVKKKVVVTMSITSLSLAFSFLGGVFMPLEYLSEEMQKVAKFIPVSWYEVANDLLMRYSSINGTVKTQIWQAFGMQVLFTVAVFAVGLVIAKYQQQENA